MVLPIPSVLGVLGDPPGFGGGGVVEIGLHDVSVFFDHFPVHFLEMISFDVDQLYFPLELLFYFPLLYELLPHLIELEEVVLGLLLKF